MASKPVIKGNVRLGGNAAIGEFVILGEQSTKTKNLSPLVIGRNARIRSHSVIYAGNRIGDDFQTGHHVLVRENNVIGKNVSIGSGSDVGRENRIGDGVRIHSSCFIPEYVTIEKTAWLGPRVTILNILHPPCPKFEDCAKGIVIRENAKIGGSVTIGPGVKIGRNSVIGSGAVVMKSIPDDSVAVGNPARVIKKVRELECKPGFFKVPYEWENR